MRIVVAALASLALAHGAYAAENVLLEDTNKALAAGNPHVSIIPPQSIVLVLTALLLSSRQVTAAGHPDRCTEII